MDYFLVVKLLKVVMGVKIYGFGFYGFGMLGYDVMMEIGGDQEFDFDVCVKDGDVFIGDGWMFECVYILGYMLNYMCYVLKEEKVFFIGDYVMGWLISIVGFFDGNMIKYIESLEKFLDWNDEIYWLIYGLVIINIKDFVCVYI